MVVDCPASWNARPFLVAKPSGRSLTHHAMLALPHSESIFVTVGRALTGCLVTVYKLYTSH